MSKGLERFVSAQEGIYESALAEIRAGQKRTYSMWFIFPQIACLGHSETAQFFSIKNLTETREYLNHPALGPRLCECAQAILDTEGRNAHEILGSPDDLKLKSSMTLFEKAAEDDGAIFTEVLKRFYAGERCALTLELM